MRGGELDSKGEFEVNVKTCDNLRCNLVFRNAAVGAPVWSIGEVCEDVCESTFRKDGGHIHHMPTGNHIDFIKRCGVYFIRIQVPKHSINKNKAATFGRHGPAA